MKTKTKQTIFSLYPYYPMKCRLKTGYKTKILWASWDGDDKFEIYKDLQESNWVATIDINSGLVEYYHSKFSVRPKVENYKFTIPELSKEYSTIKVISVNW